MYGTHCNICEKFNHFSYVCRVNINQEEVMDQKSPPYYNGKKKRSIKGQKGYILQETQVLMMTFIEQSQMHIKIQSVSESRRRIFYQEIYSKICLKRLLRNRQNKDLNDRC